MANNYGELFCQAVDTIVKERLSAISYDQTTLCTIVDDSRREEGIYTVSNGSVKFDAYSDNTSYRQGNNVYVTIPEGDWNQTKFITGKKAAKDAEVAYTYRKPFDSLVDVTGNIIYGEIKTGLIANAPSKENEYKSAITIWSYNVQNNQNKESFKGYTRLGLQAGFQSWLNPFYDDTRNNESTNVVKGSYGLRLRIYVSPDTIIDNATEPGHYDLYLDSAGMNGNPYNFETFFQQEKVFDISQFGEITQMELQFYEEPGTFFNEYGTDLKYKDFLENYIAPNLFCNDVYLCFGYDISDFGDNEVVLYSPNSSTYHPAASTTNNRKTVNLRWIHNFGNNDFKVVDDKNVVDLEAEYEIRWYKYKLGAQSADIYSGVYWERVNEGGTFQYNFDPDITLAKEQIKVIILYQGIPLRSNILVFENENEVVNQPTLDAIQAVEIFCEDNSYGNYRIYALGNSLIDSADGPKVRQWHLYFNESDLTEAESIEWIIPYENTMIVMDEDTYSSYKNVSDGNYHIIVNGDVNNAYTIINTLNYRIRSYYSQNYNRNTIECIVTKNGIKYYGTKEMTFGIQGTTGTDCTFVLDFDKGITALTRNNYEAVTITARLYDYENKDVTDMILSNSNMTITWGWKNGANSLMHYNHPSIMPKNQVELFLDNHSVSNSNYSILTATLTGWGDFPLTAYLPIPIRYSTQYQFISGPTTIIYNSLGLVGDYFSNPYAIYLTEDGLNVQYAEWEINDKTRFAPTFKVKDGKYYLVPKSIYIDESNQNLCIRCYYNGTYVWSQPLLIMQNKYPSKMINDWNGELTIDNGNNSILAARIAAGKKNGDNTFTGVVMGDWSQSTTDIGITGLYGFRNGEATFGFKEDGTAFIGGSGTGRIEFDGNKGIIESATYTDGEGMQINLKEGEINAHQFTLNAGVSSFTDSDGYTNRNGGKIYLSTEARTYPLQIGEYFSVEWDGTIHATNGEFSGKITGGSIKIGRNFEVDEDGNMTASSVNVKSGTLGSLTVSGTLTGGTLKGSKIDCGNGSFTVDGNTGALYAGSADIEGIINATELTCKNGTIGGWEINEDTIQSIAKTNRISNTILNGTSGRISTDRFIISSLGNSTGQGEGSIGIINGLTGDGTSTNNVGISTISESIVLQSGNNIRLTSYNSLYIQSQFDSSSDRCKIEYPYIDIGRNNTHTYFYGTVHFGSAKVEGLPGGSGGVAVFQ